MLSKIATNVFDELTGNGYSYPYNTNGAVFTSLSYLTESYKYDELFNRKCIDTIRDWVSTLDKQSTSLFTNGFWVSISKLFAYDLALDYITTEVVTLGTNELFVQSAIGKQIISVVVGGNSYTIGDDFNGAKIDKILATDTGYVFVLKHKYMVAK